MGKPLKHNQFIKMWYNNMPIKNKTIEKYMDDIYAGLVNTIREEVRLNGALSLKNIGKFYLIQTGGYEKTMSSQLMTADDVKTKYFVPVHYLPKFTASTNFKDYVNDALVSKEGRRKAKNGSLTDLDKELQERELEKTKTDISRYLERKASTGENLRDIIKDSRMKIKR